MRRCKTTGWKTWWETIYNADGLPNRINSKRFARLNEGFLLISVRYILWFIDVASPMFFPRFFFGLCKKSWSWLTKRCFIEAYHLFFFVLEIIILICVDEPILLYGCFVLWRLIDILQSNFTLSFMREFSSARYTTPIPARSLILTFINYAEIIMIFAVAYFVWQHCIPELSSLWKSLEYSAGVFIPLIGIESLNSSLSVFGKILFYSEIASSLFIHLLIIQRILSYYKK